MSASRALLIVDHGSRRPEAHAHLEWLADRVRERAPGLRVYVAHLELAKPGIEDAIEGCARDGVTRLAVHPLFLAPGRHVADDIPARLQRAAERHPGLVIQLLDTLGSQAEVADLILDTLAHSNAAGDFGISSGSGRR